VNYGLRRFRTGFMREYFREPNRMFADGMETAPLPARGDARRPASA